MQLNIPKALPTSDLQDAVGLFGHNRLSSNFSAEVGH